ncbi:LON peptidase N-terminal domain and RING finger protein 2-like [Topomyia yanbarensis]|uniref:LON peptidase N-terminal domain and RING finger protein 2-like n=1 Tax=Topomyia yanbarensis TaxID=2498891 RepID=UPI00273B39AB|nr:LON peptidase N-terminal domain and RING finger protein 2-like [Topomyia yanbarensis]XP_058835428.1 LON peptidase N-terminal domain and RING finger protein 2-like [Topomyia yanbarensis]XP_058835430.1 LON peptidase N-terminal domain and RING finger protein 2-like [Topomyia yanbarensis]XP_058835431.1 LON peptidase N-terminal domain and RING finger protein 2-like [Topomyia yanbarensis]XP_058835432.1 LON peptidase N-terminal domain and RING finger protein 2-like [Topomyia yanbarensis]XP_0588354
MAAMTDPEKDAFMSEYELGLEQFVRKWHESREDSETLPSSDSLREHTLSLYYGYGDSLAKAGRLKGALDVYVHISRFLESGLIPVERMKLLTSSLVETVIAKRNSESDYGWNRIDIVGSVDPLCCPICEDVLRYPITATCGHTFCRQCCFGHSECVVCNQKFPTISASSQLGLGSILGSTTPRRNASRLTLVSLASSTATSSTALMQNHAKLAPAVALEKTAEEDEEGAVGCSSSGVSDTTSGSGSSGGSSSTTSVVGFEQDILVRRLVERWWGPQLKAAEFNDEAQRYLENNALDEALRCCNQSLEHAPTSYKGLLLRSEVLYRLQHYQSALADADNALKSRPTSHKAHYYRALSQSAMGKTEQAILSHCISIFLDKQSMCVASGIIDELAKDLQKLLASSRAEPELPTSMMNPLTLLFGKPYPLMNSRKRRHHRFLSAHRHKVKKQFLSLRTSDFDEQHSDCSDEDYFRSSFFEEMNEDFYGQTMNPPHHRRKSLTAYNLNIFNPRMDEPLELVKGFFPPQQPHSPAIIIPRPNSKLRSFVDQMTQELESIRWAEGNPVRLHVNPLHVEVSDFDCVLCCRTLWRPVVTPCGHTYCWVCLDRCMDYSSSCPLCMAPLVEQFRHHLASSAGQFALLTANPTLISLSKRKVTQFLELAMQRFIPDAYEKRQRQELDREPTVPVFICTTAFPSVPCPLFVYEPRYRLMVRRAIESGERQFGIALPQQTGRQRYVEYGTMLDIRDCVQLGDGCSILSTVGARRFRVVARHEKDGYDTANVEFIEDDKIDCEGGASKDGRVHLIRELHEKVLLKAIDWHRSLSENIKCEIFKSFGKMPDLEENWEDVVDGPAWAWWIIAILPLSQHLKVDILSTTSLEKRLRAIDKTLNLEESAQQKRKRSVCVVPSSPASPPPVSCCDGLQSTVAASQHQHQQHQNDHNNHHHPHHRHQQQCQAIDCCLRERTTSTDHHHHHHEDDDHHHHHHDHHHDSDRNSSGDHHHHHHLSQSVETAEYLL